MNCQAVAGTSAAGIFGPDLTHLMSRDTLASERLRTHRAVNLENTPRRGNLKTIGHPHSSGFARCAETFALVGHNMPYQLKRSCRYVSIWVRV
jgi:hypothetical protein